MKPPMNVLELRKAYVREQLRLAFDHPEIERWRMEYNHLGVDADHAPWGSDGFRESLDRLLPLGPTGVNAEAQRLRLLATCASPLDPANPIPPALLVPGTGCLAWTFLNLLPRRDMIMYVAEDVRLVIAVSSLSSLALQVDDQTGSLEVREITGGDICDVLLAEMKLARDGESAASYKMKAQFDAAIADASTRAGSDFDAAVAVTAGGKLIAPATYVVVVMDDSTLRVYPPAAFKDRKILLVPNVMQIESSDPERTFPGMSTGHFSFLNDSTRAMDALQTRGQYVDVFGSGERGLVTKQEFCPSPLPPYPFEGESN